MFKNYCKTAWRNLSKNRGYGFINIFGLTLGLSVVMVIALWIWDELSYNKYFKNHDRIAMVVQQYSKGGIVDIGGSIPMPLSAVMRKDVGSEFKYISRLGAGTYNITAGDKKVSTRGMFMEPDGPAMLSLEMIQGAHNALVDPSAVLISESFAKLLFGDKDAVGQVIRVTNLFNLKVGGVYRDLPKNTSFSEDAAFIAAWDFFINNFEWLKREKDNWNFNMFTLYVQLAPHTNLQQANARIKNLLAQYLPKNATDNVERSLALFPMNRWRLYDKFNDKGESIAGYVTYLWLFGCIGFFVLMLACINFMNLSTARSAKRAREVGIRKTIGANRLQLVNQFFSESIMATLLSFLLAIAITQISLPWFNALTGKQIFIVWINSEFWLSGLAICLITGFIAGSYPAFYLSSFRPIKVLKGLFKAGPSANLPRKVLVVTQFAISIFLIIATTVIYTQIQFAKQRPVGYDTKGLLSVQMTTPEIYARYKIIRNELLSSGVITEMAETQCPVTQLWAGDNGFEWKGKGQDTDDGFPVMAGSIELGEVAGWQFVEGRGFSKNFATDSMGLVLSESAAKYMGLQQPVGENIKWHGKDYTVLGVVKDIMMSSPFEQDQRIIFPILREAGNFIIMRLNPNRNLAETIKTITGIFQKNNPHAPFEYTFVDEDYGKKFIDVERVGKLSTLFASLAIFISLLGLFGIASFMAEQRTKEIGIRKVLGASILTLWNLLSKELLILILIAISIAVPLGYYAMSNWLQQYYYRVDISIWVFIFPVLACLTMALLTVSIQTMKAAWVSPVKSLKTE